MENTESLDYPERRERLTEVLVFLFLIAPTMVLSFFAVRQGSLGFVIVSVSIILRDLSLLGVVLFFLWRNDEPLATVGWSAKDIRAEIGLGVSLFLPMYFGLTALDNYLVSTGILASSTPLPSLTSEKGMAEFILAFFMIAIVALTEETIFRGYLILRFRQVTSSVPRAVLYSSAIFALGHGYEGTAGVLTVGLMGIIFALIYLWRKSLVAPVIMHFLQDFLVIVVIPFLKQYNH